MPPRQKITVCGIFATGGLRMPGGNSSNDTLKAAHGLSRPYMGRG
ncbi:hypothetical protein G6011_04697, partial [Alternaria panax]